MQSPIDPIKRKQINIERITNKIDKAYSDIQLLEIRMKGQPFALRNARKQHERIIKKNEAKLLLLKTSYAERVELRNIKFDPFGNWANLIKSSALKIRSRNSGKSQASALIGDSIMSNDLGHGWLQSFGTNDFNPVVRSTVADKALPQIDYEEMMKCIKPAMDWKHSFNPIVSMDFTSLEKRVDGLFEPGSNDDKKS